MSRDVSQGFHSHAINANRRLERNTFFADLRGKPYVDLFLVFEASDVRLERRYESQVLQHGGVQLVRKPADLVCQTVGLVPEIVELRDELRVRKRNSPFEPADGD